MKTIPLSNSRLVAIVSDADFPRLRNLPWSLHKTGCAITRRWKKMHHLVKQPKRGGEIDHRNTNQLDNQRRNLRYSDRTQNLRNTNKRNGCTSQFKGVWWDSKRRKWAAVICVNKKRISLGRFIKELEAAKAYNRSAVKHFGAFARINKI